LVYVGKTTGHAEWTSHRCTPQVLLSHISIKLLICENAKKDYISTNENLELMLSTQNTKTVTLALLNSLHTAFVLSSETERNLILGQVDVAYQNIGTLEITINDLRNKNDSLGILASLAERAGVLRDILAVETETMWSKLVQFSEEGDIQLTIQGQYSCSSPPPSQFLSVERFTPVYLGSCSRNSFRREFEFVDDCGRRGFTQDVEFT
jgi:hypothetical protein